MGSTKKRAKAAAKARRYEWQCFSPFPKAFPPNPAQASTSEGKEDDLNSDCASMPDLDDIGSSSEEEDMKEVFERSGIADEANEFDSSDDDDDAINVHGLCSDVTVGLHDPTT